MGDDLPAGWYTNDTGARRYWDGAAWWHAAPDSTDRPRLSDAAFQGSRSRAATATATADRTPSANVKRATPRATGLALGLNTTAVLLEDGTVRAWGLGSAGLLDIPVGVEGVASINTSHGHIYAVTHVGAVHAWFAHSGSRDTATDKFEDVQAVAGGMMYSVALRRDGTVLVWNDRSTSGLGSPPAGLRQVIAVAASGRRSVALKARGILVGWGDQNSGTLAPPESLPPATAVELGSVHGLALSRYGSVHAWGQNSLGQLDVPPWVRDVTAIAAGNHHSLALMRDGTVAAWGDRAYGATDVPPGLSDVVAISAGNGHSGALRSDGTLVLWGRNNHGQATIPLELHGLRHDPAPPTGPRAPFVGGHGSVHVPVGQVPFSPDGRSTDLARLISGFCFDVERRHGGLRASSTHSAQSRQRALDEVEALKQRGRFHEAAERYIDESRRLHTAHYDVLIALSDVAACGGDLRGAWRLLKLAAAADDGMAGVATARMSALRAAAGQHGMLEPYLRSLCGNAAYEAPRPTDRMEIEFDHYVNGGSFRDEGESANPRAIAQPREQLWTTPTPAPALPTRVANAWGVAGATLMALMLTSTVSQYLAAATLDIVEYFEWKWSTGGLVALIASIVMPRICETWDDFRAKIWFWIVPTAILVFVAIYGQASSVGLVG